MSGSRRLVVVVFFLLMTSFVGLIFWPFTLDVIITPVALVVWTLLRVLVFSIDQKYYWFAAILITSFLLYRHLPLPPQLMPQPEEDQPSNATLRSLSYWRSLFHPMDQPIRENKILKKNLARLLVSLYAIQQHTSADFRLYDALQQGQIPLPEEIHALLFLEEPQPAQHSLRKLVQSIQDTPRKWIHRWTGQETAEHYRMVDETLCFLEASLEMKNGDRKPNSPQH